MNPVDPKSKNNLGRLLAIARPHVWWFVAGLLTSMLCGGSIFGALVASPDLLSSLTGDGPVSTGPTQLELMAVSYFNVTPRADDGSMTMAFMFLIMAFLATFLLSKAILEFISRYCLRRVGANVVCDLRNKLFSHLQQQSLGYYSKTNIGQLVSRCTNDASVVESTIANTIANATKAPFEVLAAVGYVAWFSWTKGLVALPVTMFVVLPLSMAPIFILGRLVRKYNRRALGRVAELTSRMHENFTCIRVVKAFNTEQMESERFEQENRGYLKQIMKSIVADLAMTPLMQVVAVIAACAFLYYCFLNNVHLTTIVPMAIAAFYCYEPIKKLGKVNSQFQNMLSAADRIFEILDANEIIPKSPTAKAFAEFNDSVAVNNVSFRYQSGGDLILDTVNLEVPKGGLVALVGATGSGKSTLSSLIARFYDVTEGSITLDGLDVREIETGSLRKLVGVVNQETLLFNTSITENIRYGSEGATQEQVEDAAKLAHAHEFIIADPAGYDRVVGEKGFQLSGGQRQRICIARAILRNPQILILDEATSALDTKTEQLVQSALDNLMKDRTVIAIAHRLSTIQHATQIIVLDHGKVAERGTHDELLAQGGLYASLHTMQHNGIIA